MSEIQQFSQHDIEVLNEETVYKGFFTLKKVQFKHKLFAGGESGVVTRELLVKGAASAVIAYDPKEDSVVLVEQVRYWCISTRFCSFSLVIRIDRRHGRRG